jgi:hypothetical protein
MNKKLVGSVVVGAAVLAIVVAQFWGGREAPAAAPKPSETVPAPTTTTLPTQGLLETYDFPAQPGSETGGFSIEIPVPATWAATHDKDRASYRHGDLLLETDRVPITQEDPVSGLRAVAHGGTVVAHPPVSDYDAAEWDYTYERDGAGRQVTVVGLGVGETLITIRFEAPPAEFENNRGVLDSALQVSGAG